MFLWLRGRGILISNCGHYMASAFPNIKRIEYEGPKSKNPLAFKHYNADEVIEGKTMREHLRFSVVYWHTFRGRGADMFGVGTMLRPWDDNSDSLENARRRVRVAILALLVYHLHLLCDLVGSRGPDPGDKWPIWYLAPLSQHPMWICPWQWRLDGWQNGVISIALFVWAMAMTLKRGDSVVGVFSRRADAVFMRTLRQWRDSLRVRFEKRE